MHQAQGLSLELSRTAPNAGDITSACAFTDQPTRAPRRYKRQNFYIRQRYFIWYTHRNMGRCYNQSCWLTIARLTKCGKNCMFEHCRHHRALLKKGSNAPNPCRKCGVGVQTESQLCKACGSNRVYQKLVYKERRARIIFTRVLAQLPCAVDN